MGFNIRAPHHQHRISFSCVIRPSITHLHMASGAVAQVSEVEGERVWAVSFLHHEAEVGLVPPSSPAHVRIVIDELPLGEQNSTAQGKTQKTIGREISQ